MTNFHKIFLDSTYRAPPYQPAKPFFTIFNSSNYWLQAAIVIAVFIILRMMPFMRQAAHLAGGSECPSLFGMIRDMFVCREKVHDICNQTPLGHNEPGQFDDEDEKTNGQVRKRRNKIVREAKPLYCPDENKPKVTRSARSISTMKEQAYDGDMLPPSELNRASHNDENSMDSGHKNIRQNTRSKKQTGSCNDVLVRSYCRRFPKRSRSRSRKR